MKSIIDEMLTEADKVDLLMIEHFYDGVWIHEDEEQPEACPYLHYGDGIFYPTIYKKFKRMPVGTISPTKDMNLAMECVEESNEQIKIDLTGLYKVNYWDHNGSYGYIGFDNIKEAPLAVCKALLKAKGIKYE